MNILFDDSGNFKVATILTDNDTSLQVELSSGKRCKIKANNVLLRFITPNCHQLLNQAEALATEINSEIDGDFLWEVAPNGEFSFLDFAKEYFGNDNISAVENTAILLVINALPMYFHRRGRGNFRKAPEEILQAAKAAKLKKEQLAEQINTWANDLINGNIPEIVWQHKNILLSSKRDRHSPYVKAVELACSQLNICTSELLYNNKVFNTIYEIHYLKFIENHFKEGISFKQNDLSASDLTTTQVVDDADVSVKAFSIDDSSTTEIDDAFSVRFLNDDKTIVGIHIAAPGLFIQQGSDVDAIAKRRISTVYLPGDKITMLPSQIIATCSLDEGKKVPGISLYLTINNNTLEVLESNTKIENVFISNNLRTENLEVFFNDGILPTAENIPDSFKYKAEMLFLFKFANACLKQREIFKQQFTDTDRQINISEINHTKNAETLKEINENAGKNLTNLVENGEIITDIEVIKQLENNLYEELAELNSDDDNEDEISDESSTKQIDYSFDVVGDLNDPLNCKAVLKKRIRGAPLDLIVSEMMILTNCIWGRILEEQGIPGIYRTQTFNKVRLTTRADIHVGLGVNQYAWCSSPLRRYCDLVNQWQLLACLNQQAQKAPFQQRSSELFVILKTFESKYSAYKSFQLRMELYWCLRYVQQENISEVVAVVKRAPNAKVENLPLLVSVPSLPQEFWQRDTKIKIKLNLTSINYFTLNINAEFVELAE